LGKQLASWLLSVIFLLYIEAVKVLAILGRQSKRKGCCINLNIAQWRMLQYNQSLGEATHQPSTLV